MKSFIKSSIFAGESPYSAMDMVSESNRSTDYEELLGRWYSMLRDVCHGKVELPDYAVTDMSFAQLHALGMILFCVILNSKIV